MSLCPDSLTSTRGRILVIVGTFVLLGIRTAPALADPTPFASATSNCTNPTLTFPPQSTNHPNVIYSLASTGASGEAQNYGSTFSPGDKVWDVLGSVSAGTPPTMDVQCSGGSVYVQLYDEPTVPATFTGVSSGIGTSGVILAKALGAGQYVLDTTIDQGSLRAASAGPSFTIASSGEYPLGSLNSGDRAIFVSGMSGPTAHYSLTVRELPVQISGLSGGAARYAAPGTILTGQFSVSGDTTITAYATNAAGQIVRHLGSFPVQMGNSSITWDTRGDGGASLPDGTYYLDLDSTDPNANVTSAQTSIVVDGTPPSVSLTSPGTIRPSQSISFSATDAESGVASLSLLVDGQDVADLSGNSLPPNGSFSYAGPWSVGRHTWEIQASDNVGNQADVKGSFVAANPPPLRITGSNATPAFGRWLRARYGRRLMNYWTCPTGQINHNAALCLAEIRTGRVWHLIAATAKYRNGTVAIVSSSVRSWTRRWSKYSQRIIAGFGTPGRAQANSPAFDWAFLAAGANHGWKHHKRSFVLDAYDGNGTGFSRFFEFRCKVRSHVIQCTNAFGDSLKYRP